ncbi:hypothetical protein [Candidatus Agathobaculum pullicola]
MEEKIMCVFAIGDIDKGKEKFWAYKKRRIIKGAVDDSPYKRRKQGTAE